MLKTVRNAVSSMFAGEPPVVDNDPPLEVDMDDLIHDMKVFSNNCEVLAASGSKQSKGKQFMEYRHIY